MARKKKARLTRKKKNPGQTTDKKTPNGLSAHEFASLALVYSSFIGKLTGLDRETELTYTTQSKTPITSRLHSLEMTCRWQNVVVMYVRLIWFIRAYIQHQEPEDRDVIPEEDYWIGVIQEIRATDPTDVSISLACIFS